MDDVTISFGDNPLETEFERLNEYGTEEFLKERFKSSSVTVDVAVMQVSEDERDAQIEERKEEIRDMDINVPSPYTSDIESREKDPDYPLEFEDGEVPVGTGYADPEYRLMVEDMGQIPRYRYLVTWEYFPEPGLLAEVEVYVPKDEFDRESALALARSVDVSR